MIYHFFNEEFKIFVAKSPKQFQPNEEEFSFTQSDVDAYNIMIVTVGQTIRAVHLETRDYQDYIVPGDEEGTDYVQGFQVHIPIFYVGFCESDVDFHEERGKEDEQGLSTLSSSLKDL